MDEQIKTSVPFIPDSENVTSNEANDVVSGGGYSSASIELPRGADKKETTSGSFTSVNEGPGHRSIISSYYVLRNKTVVGTNYPKTDAQFASKPDFREKVTAVRLVNNPVGASIYRPEDFIYVKNFGLVGLNRMITLRRFAFPCFDDIFSSEQKEPDVARIIGFSDQETNKLSDILSFSAGLKWKELTSSVEQMNIHGDPNGINGYMRNVLQFVDPKFGSEALRGENELFFNPLHDQNKVYGPVDSIDRTHIRDVGLDFDQDIKLTFEYELRSINGINQKSAFIDLLSNAMVLATNDAKFWGGARFWLGPRPTKYMSNLRSLAPKDFDSFLKQSHIDFKGAVDVLQSESDASGVSVFKSILQNARNLGLGKLLNKIGRPSIPYMNSLLSGNPVGLWHLTVGNPLNPIATIGDLLLTTTSVSFGDDLGIDDFPTSIKIECSLKHSKPRGRAEIESMFNSGHGRTYMKPSSPFGTTSKGSKSSPNAASDVMNMNANSYFGNLSKGDVMHNKDAVWSFLK